MTWLLHLLLTPLALITGLFAPQPAQDYGSTVPQGYSVFETYLANQQATGDTTLTLASGSLRDGTSLSGYVCVTIDSNLSTLEYECGTANGTSITGLTRGIDPLTGTTSVNSLIYAHRRGADVKITDYPILSILGRMASGVDTYPSPLLYYAHPCNLNSATTTICDKNYIDTQVLAGGAPITTSIAGIGLLATAKQAASSTATGTYNATTYNLLLASSYATDTPGLLCQSATNGGCLVMSLLNGKISQSWLDQTQAFNWTALHTFGNGLISSASSTFVSTSNFTGAATFNGTVQFNGTATFATPPTGLPAVIAQSSSSTYSSVTSTTTILSIAIPNADIGTSSTMRLQMQLGAPIRSAGSPPNSCGFAINIGTGVSTTTLIEYPTADARSAAGLATMVDALISAVNSKEYVTGNYTVWNAGPGNFTYNNGINDLLTQSTKGSLFISIDENAANSGSASCGVLSYVLSLN